MNWQPLNNINQLDEIDLQSFTEPIVLFKHSTTCPISGMAKNRVEMNWDLPYKAYYLDLLKHRDISAAIASKYGIQHESPQMLVIVQGLCVLNESHLNIHPSLVAEALN